MHYILHLYKYRGIVLFFTFSLAVFAQNPTACTVLAAPTIVHSEGVAERVGDIVLQCSGKPGVAVTASLNVMLPVAITNHINAGGYATDASLNINTGTGNVPSGVSGLVANQSISFTGFQFTFPASGAVSLVIDDLRANVNQLGLQQTAQIYATLSGSLPLGSSRVVVASALQGFLATSMDSAATCTGSPTPASLSLSSLFAAGTAEQTTRVTEGFPSSFQPKDATSDTGTRFLLSYSNVPAGAAIYVPDAVAGSGAIVPTSGGDMGTPAATGQYHPGSQTLLLVRVLNTDATGAGGTLAALPAPNGSGVLVLNGANPVPLTGGAGYAVYEVVDANPSAIDSAQIPAFFAIAPNTPPTATSGSLSLAPVSTIGSASTSAPVPRFVAVTPPSDCTAEGDCNAAYYPQLQVTATATPLQATALAGGKKVGVGNIYIRDSRGGVLDWSASVTYTNGTGWVSLTQSIGVDYGLVQVLANPSALTPGTYQATVLIDAGPIAGSQSLPVTLTVTAPAPAVNIGAVTNAADFQLGPVAPGSLATVWGSNLAGQNVTVTFNAIQATLFYTGAQQINLRIPPSLSGQPSAQMVVTVDGASSAPFTVPLTAVAPAIFTPGVLNQDNTVNSPAQPASLGTILQIFLTGMPDSGAVATVTIQNRGGLVPLYAGAAPGFPGLEQVNVAVPADLQGAPSNLTICVMGAGNQPYCSQPESLALKP